MKALLPVLAALPLLGAASSAPAGPSARCGDSYTVARHDTLYSIARRCRGSVAQIMARNGIADPRRLETGQRLILAGAAGAGPKPDDEAGAPRGHRHGQGHGHGQDLVYPMRGGDTLYSLARWSRVSLAALFAANPDVDPHQIEIGDPIRLPRGAVDPDPARTRERGPPQARAPTPPRDGRADERAKPDEPGEDSGNADDEREAEPEGM